MFMLPVLSYPHSFFCYYHILKVVTSWYHFTASPSAEVKFVNTLYIHFFLVLKARLFFLGLVVEDYLIFCSGLPPHLLLFEAYAFQHLYVW